MPIWKFFCREYRHPGLWQSWFHNSCVAVGWPPDEFSLHANGPMNWNHARNCLNAIEVGHQIVVHLPGRRFGRVGAVTGTAIEDHEWNPFVPPQEHPDLGEIGRRVFVRWDLAGPDDPGQVVHVPHEHWLAIHEVRPAIQEVTTLTWPVILEVMNTQENWVDGPA